MNKVRIDYSKPFEDYHKKSWTQTQGRKFYESDEWKTCRDKFVKGKKLVCCKCGSTERVVADHILPVRRFPQYRLLESNLQLLCGLCNRDKGNKVEVKQISKQKESLNKDLRKKTSKGSFFEIDYKEFLVFGKPVWNEVTEMYDMTVTFRGKTGDQFYDELMEYQKQYNIDPGQEILKSVKKMYEELNEKP